MTFTPSANVSIQIDPLAPVQNLMGQILDECVESVEKCWWGNGEQKPFHPGLITLAEKLGFNVERFQKITRLST